MEYEQLVSFGDEELATLAEDEHERWCDEKLAMGWVFGDEYTVEISGLPQYNELTNASVGKWLK